MSSSNNIHNHQYLVDTFVRSSIPVVQVACDPTVLVEVHSILNPYGIRVTATKELKDTHSVMGFSRVLTREELKLKIHCRMITLHYSYPTKHMSILANQVLYN